MDIKGSIVLTGLFLFSFSKALAQQDTQQANDTSKVLQEVVIKAYQYDRPVSEVPAAVAVIDRHDLERFSNTSILPTVNTIPGVRMEERSPGSYRFSIRGSLLRSPFGIRNVKIYWNGLPITDGGGNTYLNLLDFNSITTAEIIKGPGASLYGAGTGGVILLNNVNTPSPALKFSSVIGSYGLQRYQVAAQTGGEKSKISLQYAHQQADGYRKQTKMRRDALNADAQFALSPKGTLSATIFYTELFYETPGGLTKAQFEADPSQARPGAEDARAAVTNQTGYAGIMYDYAWNSKWSTKAGVYGSVTEFTNPTTRNYEKREETNAGGRTTTQYSIDKDTWKGKIMMGGEYQYFFSPVKVSNNISGAPGPDVEADDELISRQLLAFAQAEFDLPKQFYLTLGGSVNFLNYDFSALAANPAVVQRRKFDPVLSPRIALLKKLNSTLSVFGSFSRGFSPPSLAEVRPSAGTYNNTLNPERGNSYEVGLRGSAAKQQLLFDVTMYNFKLDETIVIQRADDGAEYFVNAGKTSQRGVEAKVSWTPKMTSRIISRLNIWSSYTYNHYRFENYVQDGNDFSGNRLTGIAPTIAYLGADVTFQRLYFNLTAGYTDAIPLDDRNSEYAAAYVLLGARVGYKANITPLFPVEFFAGMDNILDEHYSLGNDLNAFGGRYYNAAAPRNFYVGVSASPSFTKKRN